MKRILLIAAFVFSLFSPAAALGQASQPARPTYDPYDLSNYTRPAPRCAWYEFWCSESVYLNPNVSPNTKRQLWEQDPNICHTEDCQRARLAAGVEYMGLDPVVRPPLRVPRPVYTPVQPYKVYPLRWCRSLMNYTPRQRVPGQEVAMAG